MPKNHMDWISNIFGKVFNGATGDKYAALSAALGLGGNVLKNLDADNKGVDDIAGEFCIAGAKILGSLGKGDRTKARAAIDAARITLDSLENVIEAAKP